jgi:hypothetical protein
MSEFKDFLNHLASAKEDPIAKKAREKEQIIREHIKEDFGSLLSQLSALKKGNNTAEPLVQKLEENVLNEIILDTPIGQVPEPVQVEPIEEPSIDKYLKAPVFSDQPEKSQVDYSREINLVTKKLTFLEQWIGKISNAGPGSGETRLEFLDDVDRTSAKSDGKYLKYDFNSKKWVGDALTTGDITYNTTLVTTSTYTVQDGDWYIGVNYAGAVTITIPASATNGRVLVIKDESGNASTNPITVLGTVDNDVGGFILQMDNGGTQMVYRAGWRII